MSISAYACPHNGLKCVGYFSGKTCRWDYKRGHYVVSTCVRHAAAKAKKNPEQYVREPMRDA